MKKLRKVVSGGQTGADRGALDAALHSGLEIGGWCPKGRLSEDGKIPARYDLRETPSSAYEQRTEWNVRDSDGTLILHRGEITGGTALTRTLTVALRRPQLCLDLTTEGNLQAASKWLKKHGIRTLNVAGPRESSYPGISAQVCRFLSELIGYSNQDCPPGARTRASH